jgi:hypothetical protein
MPGRKLISARSTPALRLLSRLPTCSFKVAKGALDILDRLLELLLTLSENAFEFSPLLGGQSRKIDHFRKCDEGHC